MRTDRTGAMLRALIAGQFLQKAVVAYPLKCLQSDLGDRPSLVANWRVIAWDITRRRRRPHSPCAVGGSIIRRPDVIIARFPPKTAEGQAQDGRSRQFSVP